MQEVILVLAFLTATLFMGRKIYRQYKAESGCAASGCDSCAPDQSNKKVKLPEHFKS